MSRVGTIVSPWVSTPPPPPPLPKAGAQLRPNASGRVSTQTRYFYAEVEDCSRLHTAWVLLVFPRCRRKQENASKICALRQLCM